MSISGSAPLTELLLDDHNLVYPPENEATMLDCGEAWIGTCDGVIFWWRWHLNMMKINCYCGFISVNLASPSAKYCLSVNMVVQDTAAYQSRRVFLFVTQSL